MVTKLKFKHPVKGIDGKAPPGVEPTYGFV